MKSLAAVSAAIDLAQGIGNPVAHIAAVRDLAKECEQLAEDLTKSRTDNSGLRVQLMSLHQGIMQMQKELEQCYDREASRFSARFDVTADPCGYIDSRAYTIHFQRMTYILPNNDAIAYPEEMARMVAAKMARKFEEQAWNMLLGKFPASYR